MHVQEYDLVLLLFLLLCVNASRLTSRADADKITYEAFFAPGAGVRRPAATPSVHARPAVHVPKPVEMRHTPALHLPSPQVRWDQVLARQELGHPLVPSLPGPAGNRHSGFQVFSDIDDTLVCSGGPPAGVDQSCYKKEVYPGALQFLLELSRGPNESRKPSKVVPLSERPAELQKALSLKEKNPVLMEGKRTGETNGLLSWGLDLDNAQYGKLRDFLIPRGRGAGMHRTAFDRWKKFETDKPTVFVGDNGEGDQSAAEGLALQADNRLQAAFIHDVRRQGSQSYVSDKIHVFDTYYDAAGKAFELGLISQAGMERVAQAFASSTIVQMCQNQAMFTDGQYPCIDEETGNLFDTATSEPLQAGLTLDIEDGTAYIPECSDHASRTNKPSIVSPRSKWSRCSSISRVMDEISADIVDKFHHLIGRLRAPREISRTDNPLHDAPPTDALPRTDEPPRTDVIQNSRHSIGQLAVKVELGRVNKPTRTNEPLRTGDLPQITKPPFGRRLLAALARHAPPRMTGNRPKVTDSETENNDVWSDLWAGPARMLLDPLVDLFDRAGLDRGDFRFEMLVPWLEEGRDLTRGEKAIVGATYIVCALALQALFEPDPTFTGHLSFIFFFLAYLVNNNNKLTFRLIAIQASALGIFSQLIEKPQGVTDIIPVFYNTLFLFINSYYALRLRLGKQRITFSDLDEEIYVNAFEPLGLGRPQFRKAMSLAETQVVGEDEMQVVFTEGDPLVKFFLTLDGEIDMVKGGVAVAKLGPYQFIGEAALLENLREGTTALPARSTMVAEPGARYLSWTQADWFSLMRKDAEFAYATQLLISRTLSRKLGKARDDQRMMLEIIFTLFDRDSSGSICATELRSALRALGNNLSRAEAVEAMKRYDSNQDGLIDAQEFLGLVRDLPEFAGVAEGVLID